MEITLVVTIIADDDDGEEVDITPTQEIRVTDRLVSMLEGKQLNVPGEELHFFVDDIFVD